MQNLEVQHVKVLSALSDDVIVSSKNDLGVPFKFYKALYEARYINGLDASDSDGYEYIHLEITLLGRSELKKYIEINSIKHKGISILKSINQTTIFAALCVSLSLNAIQLLA